MKRKEIRTCISHPYIFVSQHKIMPAVGMRYAIPPFIKEKMILALYTDTAWEPLQCVCVTNVCKSVLTWGTWNGENID